MAGRDRAAFERLYEMSAGRLLSIMLRLVRDRSVADELLQDVFLTIWRRAGAFDARRGRASAWLAAVSRNTAIDWLRRQDREAPPGIDPERLEDPGAAPATEADRSARSVELQRCLAGLPEAQRSSIRLAFIEGLTHHDLADRLATPLGTVKARIRRGILGLKRCLEGRVDAA